jgi:hypothetical protein
MKEAVDQRVKTVDQEKVRHTSTLHTALRMSERVDELQFNKLPSFVPPVFTARLA